MKDIKVLEKNIDYQFNDIDILKNALIHTSYSNEKKLNYNENNERLEFIGDAYLDAIVGRRIFDDNPNLPEGELSKMRASLVCEESLADLARKIELGKHLFLGKTEIDSHGEDKDSILSDSLEALIGAIIIDGGFNAGENFVISIYDGMFELAYSGKLDRDYKSKFQEIFQEKYKNHKFKYVIREELGPDHNKLFKVDILFNEKVIGSGSGKSKIKAEQAAAKDAIEKGDF